MSDTPGAPNYIAPERFYTLQGFKTAAGIGDTLIRRARRGGVQIPAKRIGRRKFIRGDDGIRYLEQVARLQP